MEFEPNSINCWECGTRSYVDFPTIDTECPVCVDNGREDVWCHEVEMVVSCPKGGENCTSLYCNFRGEHPISEDEWEDAVEGLDYIADTTPAKLPPACAKPCRECPWREESAPGWLGPWTADEWLALVNSDEPVACHITIETDNVWTARTRQCAGAASYRKSMGKLPRNPEVVTGPIHPNIMVGPMSFLHHHTQGAGK